MNEMEVKHALYVDRVKPLLERGRQLEQTLKAIAQVLEKERVSEIGLHAALDKVRALTALALADPMPPRPR
ncbi:hypothetical protein ACWENQ_08490 [Nonomuraea sp. NPDC004354]